MMQQTPVLMKSSEPPQKPTRQHLSLNLNPLIRGTHPAQRRCSVHVHTVLVSTQFACRWSSLKSSESLDRHLFFFSILHSVCLCMTYLYFCVTKVPAVKVAIHPGWLLWMAPCCRWLCSAFSLIRGNPNLNQAVWWCDVGSHNHGNSMGKRNIFWMLNLTPFCRGVPMLTIKMPLVSQDIKE